MTVYRPKTAAIERAQLLTRQRGLDKDAYDLLRLILMDLDRAESLVRSFESAMRKLRTPSIEKDGSHD